MPGCDRISELPESLLTHILSYLPTKHSVKTSALSKRWKNLWLSVPSLNLNRSDFRYREDEVVLSFFDRLLAFDPDSRLLNVKVECDWVEIDGLKERISRVIKRGPQHLDVESCTKYLDPDTETYPYVEFVPLNLYTSRTLVTLKLKFSGVEAPPGFVCMPCLKFMTLVEVHFQDDVTLERLVSGCPLLEELTLVRDMQSSFVGEVDRVMSVRSGSLKRFRVPFWFEMFCFSSVRCTLEIDAPRLEEMTLGEDQFDSVVVKNLTCLFIVELDIKFGEFFLSGITSVGHMIISVNTVKALELYSRVGLIPKFNNLSRLEAEFPSVLLQFLPVFLECCPNLKHLILEVFYSRLMGDAFELANVPQCFLSTLLCVELKGIHDWEEEEMKVATYFLENAAVLKKLTLSLADYPRRVPDEEIFEEVNKVTKRSPTCQILLDWELC